MSSRKARGRVADILEALMASPRPLSAYDLIATIGPQVPASPPTIYRALKKLISDGKVHRIESLNAFVACRHSRCAEPDHEHERRSQLRHLRPLRFRRRILRSCRW